MTGSRLGPLELLNEARTLIGRLKTLLRAVKLGRCLDTLPERLALAKARDLSHHEFLELVLADEVTRRETSSASLRAWTGRWSGGLPGR